VTPDCRLPGWAGQFAIRMGRLTFHFTICSVWMAAATLSLNETFHHGLWHEQNDAKTRSSCKKPLGKRGGEGGEKGGPFISVKVVSAIANQTELRRTE
jgi:hypothetical protein